MKTTAVSPDLPTPPNATQQMCRAALEALLKMGLEVADASARLAGIERLALEVLGKAVEEATRGILAAPNSMEAAIEAGRVADASEASRDAVAARLASITETNEKAARSVRRTVMLLQRGEQALRPERAAAARARPPGEGETRERGERQDDPEREDEIGDRPTDEVVRDICRDLGIEAAPGGNALSRPVMPASVQAFLAQAERSGDVGSRPAPTPAREPDT